MDLIYTKYCFLKQLIDLLPEEIKEELYKEDEKHIVDDYLLFDLSSFITNSKYYGKRKNKYNLLYFYLSDKFNDVIYDLIKSINYKDKDFKRPFMNLLFIYSLVAERNIELAYNTYLNTLDININQAKANIDYLMAKNNNQSLKEFYKSMKKAFIIDRDEYLYINKYIVKYNQLLAFDAYNKVCIKNKRKYYIGFSLSKKYKYNSSYDELLKDFNDIYEQQLKYTLDIILSINDYLFLNKKKKLKGYLKIKETESDENEKEDQ